MMQPGGKYSVRVDHWPDRSESLGPKTHYIGIQTETIETFCTFGFDELNVDADDEYFELHAHIVGDGTLVNRYEWRCSIDGEDKCTLNFEFVNGEGNKIRFKPIEDSLMYFELHLEKEYPDTFIDLSTCSTTLNVKQNVTPLSLV